MVQAARSYDRTLPRGVRRARGAFYTPAALVERVVDETLASPLAAAAWRADGTPELRVLDPSCGDGRFLVAALARIALASPRGAAGAADVRAACVRRGVVVGVDRDAAAASLARAALGDEAADVRVGESLAGGVIEAGGYDVIVGNPPYLRSVALRREDPALWRALRGRFAATSHGEWDLYAAFLEASLAWVAPGGAVGFVVPSRWLTARAASRLRALLHERRALRRVVDFGARQVFEGATIYTCLTFLSAAASPAVQVSHEADAARAPVKGEIAYEALVSGAPWTLSVGAAAAELARLRAAGPPLGALARIAKGAGTNADPVFLVDRDDPSVGRGEPLRLPCIRGRDVAPYALVDAREALLPYDPGSGALLEPAELRRRAPSATAHFERHRALLEARERGRFAGDTFYRWGRPQNLGWHLDPAPKIVVPDAAAAGRAALDDRGRLVIDTAYAIRPLDARAAPIGLLLAVLNSPVVATWLRATGIPLRGGYFRMKTAYLESLPVPDPATPAARALAADALVAGPDDAAELGRRTLALYAR